MRVSSQHWEVQLKSNKVIIPVAQKDACTHSGNLLKGLHYPVSHGNISVREQLAHGDKGASFTAWAVYM